MRCWLKTTLLQNKLRWSKIMCYIGGFSLILWFCFNILAVTVFRNQLYKTSLSPWNRTLGIRFKHSTVLESGFLTLDLFKPSYWPKNKKFYAKKTKQNKKIPYHCYAKDEISFLSFCLCLNARFRALSEKYFLESPHIVLTFAERKVYARLFFS